MLDKLRSSSRYNFYWNIISIIALLLMIIAPIVLINSINPVIEDQNLAVNLVLLIIIFNIGLIIIANRESQYLVRLDNLDKCKSVLEQYRKDSVSNPANAFITKKLFTFSRTTCLTVFIFNNQKITLLEYKVGKYLQKSVGEMTFELNDLNWKYCAKKHGYTLYAKDLGDIGFEIKKRKALCFINQFQNNENAYENLEKIITTRFISKD